MLFYPGCTRSQLIALAKQKREEIDGIGEYSTPLACVVIQALVHVCN